MIEHSGFSEQGPVRETNEDFIAHQCPEEPAVRLSKGHLFAIADGVGGTQAGEVASREATQQLISSYYGSPKRWGRAMEEAFQRANLHVYDLGLSNPEYRKMQTTLSAIVLVEDRAMIGHVGDTRIYLVRGGTIQQLTRDHSEVNELVRMQIITPEMARHHPRRNIITRAIGTTPFLQPEFRKIEIEPGDIFVMCTDGVWEFVEEQEILTTLTEFTPAESCRRLLDGAIKRGTNDNISIQIAKVVKCERSDASRSPSKPNWLQRKLQIFGKTFGKNQKGASDPPM